jgi:hypothetical protein
MEQVEKTIIEALKEVSDGFMLMHDCIRFDQKENWPYIKKTSFKIRELAERLQEMQPDRNISDLPALDYQKYHIGIGTGASPNLYVLCLIGEKDGNINVLLKESSFDKERIEKIAYHLSEALNAGIVEEQNF